MLGVYKPTLNLRRLDDMVGEIAVSASRLFINDASHMSRLPILPINDSSSENHLLINEFSPKRYRLISHASHMNRHRRQLRQSLQDRLDSGDAESLAVL
jgi:hypothetical protein